MATLHVTNGANPNPSDAWGYYVQQDGLVGSRLFWKHPTLNFWCFYCGLDAGEGEFFRYVIGTQDPDPVNGEVGDHSIKWSFDGNGIGPEGEYSGEYGTGTMNAVLGESQARIRRRRVLIAGG
jgi:hypothetical protein